MKERPLLIIVMAILHILEPLFKIFYFKTKTNFDLSIILSNVTTFETIGLKGLIDFWLIFPFAGIALLSVKKYAWYFFVLTQAYSIVTHLTYERFSWPYFSEIPFFLSVLLIMILLFIPALKAACISETLSPIIMDSLTSMLCFFIALKNIPGAGLRSLDLLSGKSGQ